MEKSKPWDITRSLSLVLGGFALLLLGVGMGRLSAVTAVNFQPQTLHLQTVQFSQSPEELIPLAPGPGQGPGLRPGQQPGQGDCPVFIYQDGRLYQLPRPDQQPGQQPGQGPGFPEGPQELIPLQPGPSLPLPSPLPSPVPTEPPSIKAVPDDNKS